MTACRLLNEGRQSTATELSSCDIHAAHYSSSVPYFPIQKLTIKNSKLVCTKGDLARSEALPSVKVAVILQARISTSIRNNKILKRLGIFVIVAPAFLLASCGGGSSSSGACASDIWRTQTCSEPTPCTLDVKQCADGSFVSRNGCNNCAFYPCPEACI